MGKTWNLLSPLFQDCLSMGPAYEESELMSQTKRQRTAMTPHRHCTVCWAPIPLDRDPPICRDESCSITHSKREASRKRFTVMLYLFPAIALVLAVLSAMQA